jgi:hypothetical protein
MSESRRPLTSLALVGHLGTECRPGGGLVVERRQHQAVVAGLDEQSGQDRNTGADRKAACRPGDGIREYVAVDAELHVAVPSQDRGAARSREPHRGNRGLRILPRGTLRRECRPVRPQEGRITEVAEVPVDEGR